MSVWSQLVRVDRLLLTQLPLKQRLMILGVAPLISLGIAYRMASLVPGATVVTPSATSWAEQNGLRLDDPSAFSHHDGLKKELLELGEDTHSAFYFQPNTDGFTAASGVPSVQPGEKTPCVIRIAAPLPYDPATGLDLARRHLYSPLSAELANPSILRYGLQDFVLWHEVSHCLRYGREGTHLKSLREGAVSEAGWTGVSGALRLRQLEEIEADLFSALMSARKTGSAALREVSRIRKASRVAHGDVEHDSSQVLDGVADQIDSGELGELLWKSSQVTLSNASGLQVAQLTKRLLELEKNRAPCGPVTVGQETPVLACPGG